MKYHDEKLNREFDLPCFNDVTVEDLQENHKEEIFDAMYEAITVLADTNSDYVPCMILNDVVFCINRDHMMGNIESTIDYFAGIEEFEKCKKINDIKKEHEKRK